MSPLHQLDTMRALVDEGHRRERTEMKRSEATCDNCYFRREGLCALPGNVPCPTYRAASAVDALSPPQQPRLVPRPLPRVALGHAT